MEHTGESVAKDMLLASVWGTTSTPARTSSTSASAGSGPSSASTSSRRCAVQDIDSLPSRHGAARRSAGVLPLCGPRCSGAAAPARLRRRHSASGRALAPSCGCGPAGSTCRGWSCGYSAWPGILIFERWEAIPFHLIWITFALLYSFRVRDHRATMWVLAAMIATTFAAISLDVLRGAQPADELTEVPLMAAMFWVMMWHGRRRVAANTERAPPARKTSGCWPTSGASCRTPRTSSGRRSRSRSGTPSCSPGTWPITRTSGISTWSWASSTDCGC